MSWKYKELVETLAGLYYVSNQIIVVLIKTGLEPSNFDLTGSAKDIWTLIINKLEKLDKVNNVISVALADYPENSILKDYFLENSTDRKSAYSGEETVWKGGVEKKGLIKRNRDTVLLLDIIFLEIGLARSKSVGRIVTPNALATGFLITDTDLFLTANHVINQKPKKGEVKVQFNFQKGLDGNTTLYEEFEIDELIFYTSVEDDWTVLKILSNPSSKYSYLPLQQSTTEKEGLVNIVQHPGGGHKKLALYNNLVTYVDERRIQYLTDTLPGASGSPVFNLSWNVVALHHSGGWLKEPGNDDHQFMRNEGISINCIRSSLIKLGVITN